VRRSIYGRSCSNRKTGKQGSFQTKALRNLFFMLGLRRTPSWDNRTYVWVHRWAPDPIPIWRGTMLVTSIYTTVMLFICLAN
jgi:hypothetical protein